MLSLDRLLPSVLLCGIVFTRPLVLVSFPPIFLRHYHFLKPVYFLGANRTESASVGLYAVRVAIAYRGSDTIQLSEQFLQQKQLRHLDNYFRSLS